MLLNNAHFAYETTSRMFLETSFHSTQINQQTDGPEPEKGHVRSSCFVKPPRLGDFALFFGNIEGENS